MSGALVIWEFFDFDAGIVEVARHDGLWRVRVSGRETAARTLDEGLERLLKLSNSEVARLTIRILDWQASADGDSPSDERARLQREAALLRRLLAQEESKARPDSLVARAARQLLVERAAGTGKRHASARRRRGIRARGRPRPGRHLRLAAPPWDLRPRARPLPACSLGRVAEQLRAYRRWLKPSGVLVLEEPDSASWRLLPDAPAVDELIGRIRSTFRDRGGDFDIGRRLPALLDGGQVDAHVLTLPPSHPYLRLPLQFAASLGLEQTESAALELTGGDRYGLTFTLIQA